MQHRGEGGRGGEEGKGKRRLNPKALGGKEERRKMKREGVSKLKE